ncbi:MAG: hypothetical protein V3R75_07305 [Alphaproteobacteria bacterium]
MIRPATLALLTLAGAAGGALFHVSYEVRALKDELASLDRQIVADRDDVHVLRAEWSYLNQPARLEELSRRHLGLAAVTADQIGTLAALPMRPPPDTAEKVAEPALPVRVDATAPAKDIVDAVPAVLAAAKPRRKPPALARVSNRLAGAAPGRSLDDVLSELLTPATLRTER